MTELQLYKFLNENSIEHHWERENKELIGEHVLSDGGIMVNLRNGYIALDLVPIAEYHEIDLENVLEQE